MKIYDLIPFEVLNRSMQEGFIRSQKHPTLPLAIYNYTEKTQFANEWNKATLACRGLIVNTDTHDVVARPFPKFFNLGQTGAPELSLDEPVVVTDKLDGSLGILYPTGLNSWAIATRGSFTSTQAVHATTGPWLRLHAEVAYQIRPELTYLFEIIYPENRIVVDYGKTDDLVLLGAVDKRSGHVYGPDMFPGWFGPRASTFPYRTLREAVQARPRPGKEGFVVRSLMDNTMVKIKQEEYVQLHRIVTGLNEKAVWERLRDGVPVYDNIPDELHQWVADVANKLHLEYASRRSVVDTLYGNIVFDLTERLGRGWGRQAFASMATKYDPWLKSCLFLMLDNKVDAVGNFIWKQLEPKGGKGPHSG